MPLWRSYLDFSEAIQELPVKVKPKDTYSIPDVYGKAIQFYFALEDAYNQIHYDKEEVALWRGLIALLALKDHLDLPLNWEKVTLSGRDAFCNALQFTPAGFSAFPQGQKARQWDGSLFYVLRWYGKQAEDLLLYSPATLVYPVADWRSVFSGIPGIPCFNYADRRFDDPADVLEDHEKKIVYYWLDAMAKAFGSPDGGPVQATVRQHLNQYMKDLHVSLSSREVSCMKPTPISNDGGLDSSIGALNNTVDVVLEFKPDRIRAKSFFSEQLCCFVTSESNPFQNCSNSQKYKIRNRENWYALLPFHSSLRTHVPELAGGVEMAWVDRADGAYICVTMKMPSSMSAGMDLVKDYKVLDGGTQQEDLPLEGPVLRKDVAVKCPSSSGALPLIAVWPGTICNAWKEYYVLLEDPYTVGTTLEIYDKERDAGENKYAVKVNYLPGALPIERVRGSQRLSVGMITPQVSQAHQANTATISADVAVDFGTSSTRVFAKIQGGIDKLEIKISDDTSFIVTGGGNGGSRNTVRSNLVPFKASLESPDRDENLFSIYKRSSLAFLDTARPVLDGLIYRAEADENVESFKCFMPDLKWSVQHNQTYLAAFIKQLCLHVMVILHQKYSVNDITWHYSMPESLGEESQKIITNIWLVQVQDYLKHVSGEIKNHVNKCSVTESEAASRYFLFDEVGFANDEKGFLVVDIGGGSTDIALWQRTPKEKVMKWHTSVGVAGRMMFTRWIKKYLENLYGQPKDGPLKKMVEVVLSNTMSDEVQTALVERILGSFSDTLKKNYEEETNRHVSGWGMELCARINQAVSLLMFALGCQVGQMIFNKEFSIPAGEGSFVIAVGGTGSKILDWTLCSNETKEYFFRMGTKFSNGSIRSAIELQPSEQPKCEVARGLLETTVPTSGRPKTVREGSGLDYQKAVREFEKAYNEKFGTESDSNPWALPKLKINKSHVANELKKYNGKQGDIVKVFMECIYECICMEHKEIPKAAPEGAGKEGE